MAALTEPTPALDLTTDRLRMTVKIDGIAYVVRSPSDLSLTTYSMLERVTPQIGELLCRDRTPAEDKALGLHLKRLCLIALDAPEIVLAKLGQVDRLRIYTLFIGLLSTSLQSTGAARLMAAKASRSSGASSSRNSRGSTPRTRPSGSRSSRSGRSART
jgi:hypothetical protein